MEVYRHCRVYNDVVFDLGLHTCMYASTPKFGYILISSSRHHANFIKCCVLLIIICACFTSLRCELRVEAVSLHLLHPLLWIVSYTG